MSNAYLVIHLCQLLKLDLIARLVLSFHFAVEMLWPKIEASGASDWTSLAIDSGLNQFESNPRDPKPHYCSNHNGSRSMMSF